MADLQRELNRIAGTTGLDEAAAASRYAGLTTVTDTVDALNRKAGTRGLDLAAVLSNLAGLAHPIDATAAAALIGTGGVVWTPASIVGIVDYWDTDIPASVTQSGGLVSAWAGRVASTSLTQGTGAFKPTTGATTINGHNVFDFNATHWLENTSWSTLSQPFTVWAVYKISAGSTKNRAVVQFSGDVQLNDTPDLYGVRAGSDLNGSATTTTVVSHIGVFNGASSVSYINGVSDAAGAAGANATGTTIRVGGNSGSSFLTGSVALVAVSTGIGSASDRTAWQTYVSPRYGSP